MQILHTALHIVGLGEMRSRLVTRNREVIHFLTQLIFQFTGFCVFAIAHQGDEKSTVGNTTVVSANYAISPRFSVAVCYLDFSSGGTGLGFHSLLFGGNVRF